jgi:N-acetylmuramoyl-L-alanine amidase
MLKLRDRAVQDEGRGRLRLGPRGTLSKGRSGGHGAHSVLGRRVAREDGFGRFTLLAIVCVAAAACARAGSAGVPAPAAVADSASPALPPVPHADGPLRLDVGYPPEGARLTARDSNFIFGSTGSGLASLTINGAPVEVAANGGFLAFLPVPEDGLYRLRASKNGETAELTRTVRLPVASTVVPAGPAILSGTPYPGGALALPPGETFEVGFRGVAGARAWLITPYGVRHPMAEDRARSGNDAAAESFRTVPAPGMGEAGGVSTYRRSVVAVDDWFASDTTVPQPELRRSGDGASTRYGFEVRFPPEFEARRTGSIARSPGTRLDTLRALAMRVQAVTDSFNALAVGVTIERERHATLEFVAGSDTARMPLSLNLAVLDPAEPRVGEAWPAGESPPPADWTIRGRPAVSGPYHYFWPAGTRLHIDGERNGMLRVRLSQTLSAWVPASDVTLLEAGTPLPRATIAGARFSPGQESVDLRVPTAERLPFHVTESERRLRLEVFGATSAINFFQYGGLDPLIERAEWEQPAEHVFRVDVHLAEPLWGWEAYYDASDALVLRIRRPPAIDPDRPLAGKIIVVDAGHGGADTTTVGPTRLTEAAANLMVAQKLAPMLEAAGARVVMTRTDGSGVALGDRPRIARDSGAHALVSVHNNAFPDGVNPFENSGTSVYYYHPHSADMARLFQRELLEELELRDIGYGRADLALARPTWMPAVLTETMFMMVPQHEAALRDPAVQERIARAHLRALEAFFRRRARE